MKGFMHKDPLNLTGEYDTTEYKKLIPKVEIPKNHKHQNVNRHKQKMKAKRLRKMNLEMFQEFYYSKVLLICLRD